MDSSLYEKATNLLIKFIAVPSFSKEEDEVASVLEEFFEKERVHSYRKGNNVWARNQYFDPAKPTVLLNSHLDTVKPNPQYTRDPFKPEIIDGKLYGLGSNDAGGPLVSLIATFLHYYPQQNLKYNVMLAATAEEEISGTGGVESIWSSLPPVDFAIVGEPTLCQMATAEKGLMVLDCIARGKAGHAAREEGINAIYEALPDIEWFRNYKFPIVSKTLGPIKMTVTIINAGKQHNVVPAECHYTVDVRVTDAYSLEELLEEIRKNVKSEVSPRSLRMRPSGIAEDHPLVKAAIKLGIERYGSPTTSDQALIPAPSIKMGPGDSARSHTADEFIYADEIRKGIETYIKVLNEVIL
ncbi:M20 family metallo-hydrolase [Ohtaekwangia sp.]|uniref:M20 family metallo-hydrolase n=1 Tax=Ohtaekwangia sp. TaxID=2066019 RepID=UPI002F9203D3